MLRITATFPLGVYHAVSGAAPDEPEWPPSPVRLVGALLAAAHGRHGIDPEPERALLRRVCAAAPPLIVAPDSAAIGEQSEGANAVARLRGATRWAPRNHVNSRLGVSPRNIGRERSPVSKVGVAIGELPVHFVWPDIALDDDEQRRLSLLAGDVTFLGTTRSPVLLSVGTDATLPADATWTPSNEAPEGVAVRVPDQVTIPAFDAREAARRSSGGRVRPAGLIPQLGIGSLVRYARPTARRSRALIDARWWGEVIVLALDAQHSQIIPKAPAAYLLARAVRAAVLQTYGAPGSEDEAPSILTARGADPHCAFVPLPHVWGDHGDGRVLGVAVVLPHERRVADLPQQRMRLEVGLRRLLGGGPDGKHGVVTLPGAGDVVLAAPSMEDMRKRTLQPSSYARAARRWVSITPVVHSRWRKRGLDGLLAQVRADCEHVGLPAPREVKVLRAPAARGAAARLVPVRFIPRQWRGPLQGPADHLELTFDEPVQGPILLGKARHFGVGLCVPARQQHGRASDEQAIAA